MATVFAQRSLQGPAIVVKVAIVLIVHQRLRVTMRAALRVKYVLIMFVVPKGIWDAAPITILVAHLIRFVTRVVALHVRQEP
jgi:hypothetical protein